MVKSSPRKRTTRSYVAVFLRSSASNIMSLGDCRRFLGYIEHSTKSYGGEKYASHFAHGQSQGGIYYLPQCMICVRFRGLKFSDPWTIQLKQNMREDLARLRFYDAFYDLMGPRKVPIAPTVVFTPSTVNYQPL